MKKIYQQIILGFFIATIPFSTFAQQSFFGNVTEGSFEIKGKRTIFPQKYRLLESNTERLKDFLWSLPSEQNVLNRHLSPEILLPLPDGSTQRFHIWESSIQEPELQSKYSEIRTFCGQGIDDPYATVRLDFNPYFGFHAQILTPNGTFYIDPYTRGDIDHYISYFKKDHIKPRDFICEYNEPTVARPGEVLAGPCRGTTLKTYRLAVACTGEYAAAVGGTTKPALHAAIVTSANRVNGVYELEVAVRLVLVAKNDTIEFLSASTDPFNGNNNAGILINESQSVISSRIGTANYDIGHTFSTGGGGLAGLGVVCNAGQKARGITGSPQPTGDDYDIDYVAHEMGHQFGGQHTFNSSTGGCGGNRANSAAYEVGAGTTIMAYAGLCGSDNTQPNSDPVFHAISFDEIGTYIGSGGAGCGQTTQTGNTLPVITSMDNAGASIPLNTPFTLTGLATDADGDALSYCWEEWDLGASTSWNGGNSNTSSPLFKSRLPKTSGSRTFPDIAVIQAGFPTNPSATMGGLKGETLPTQARTMKFRLTVRDNRAGGSGIVSGGSGCQTGLTAAFSISTIANTGPFRVSYPNGGESFPGGSAVTVTWDIAGTNVAPINAANVKISLSTNGGLTFPTVLSASTANDGTESVTLPTVLSTTARVKVEAVGNVFFDISNANFSITQAAIDFSFNNANQASVNCGTASSATIPLGTSATGGFSTPINLTASGAPAGTNVSFSVNPLNPGSSTDVTLNNINTLSPGTYNITVTGTAGASTKTTTITYLVQAGVGPSIVIQPTDAQFCVTGNVSFTASSPTATSFQWQVSTNGGGTWADITDGGFYSGALTNTLTITGANNSLSGNKYRLVASILCGSTNSSNATLTNVAVTPAFAQVAPVCAGATLSALPTTSNNNINGSWSPAINNTATTTYTFTPALGECANSATMTITVNQPVTPAFNQINPICSGANLNLPNNSTNGISGSWAPAPNNTITTTYTFTPNAGQCVTGTVATMTVQVRPIVIPVFTQVPAVCQGSTPPSLPSSSTNGVNGNWSPAPNNNSTTTYTFTPTPGQCGVNASMTVAVNPNPVVSLSASPSTTVQLGTSVTLTATSNPASSSYEWYHNGSIVSGATSGTLVVTYNDISSLGDYYAIGTDDNDCSGKSNTITLTPAATTLITPNPTSIGYFNINLSTPSTVLLTRVVSLFDSKGALVFKKTFQTNGVSPIRIDTAPFSSGPYFVEISEPNGKNPITGKVLILKR